MAETCIVCLGDLIPHDEGPALATDATLVQDGATNGVDNHHHAIKLEEAASKPTDHAADAGELVAHLLPCGHNLHNECLKPWVERANSCPICRANFNMVELSSRIGGAITSSYAVQDKRQVAEIDPSMVVEDDFYFEEEAIPDYCCMVCDDVGDLSQLMECHSCENCCHVFCAGLDEMPNRGPWYCQLCMESPPLLRAAGHRPAIRGPAAYLNPRRRTSRTTLTSRRARAPDEWVDVWQSVWDRLHFDIEFPFEDDDLSESRSVIERRENEEWERRFELARQMGAGSRLRAAADTITTQRQRPANRTLHREVPQTPKSPNPESQEELRAWNAFEKAREQVAEEEAQDARPASVTSTTRRRKRKSTTSSPAEPQPQEAQPERKLKRPRTRLNINTAESSATAAARRPTTASHTSPPAATPINADDAVIPGFLQSLLQEVEVDRFAQDREIAAPQPKRVIVERACSPQNSSPGLSPAYPNAGMSTPPPLNINRTDSPTQRDQQLSPTYSPYSPADDDARPSRRKVAHRHYSPGLHSPPRSKDSSPTRPALSYSTKRELQLMVTAVLKPMYVRKEVSKEEYTDINRDISRLLYDKVAEAGTNALASQGIRDKWQKIASNEVDNAVKALAAARSAASPPAEDSASSSS